MSISASLRPPVPADRRMTRWTLLLTLLGLALRIAGARNDFWLDEITSLTALKRVDSVWQIFWKINDENNHFLNTLYLYLAGPDQSFLVLRACSIAAGVFTISVAGLLARRSQPDTIAAVIAMAAFALSYAAIHYGSEARGYIIMVLASLLAWWRVERGLTSLTARAEFGVILFIGVLGQTTMLFFILALMVRQTIHHIALGGGLETTLYRTVGDFLIGGILTVTIAIGILWGWKYHPWHHHGTIYDPLPMRLRAVDQFYDYALGLPPGAWCWTGLCACVGLLLLAVRCRHLLAEQRLVVYFSMMAAYPAWLTFSGIPEVDEPRYMMPALAPLLLLASELATLGLRLGGAARVLTVIVLCICLAGNAVNLAHFYRGGRGHYSQAVLDMTADGPAVYDVMPPAAVRNVAQFHAGRLGRDLKAADAATWCETPPVWFIWGRDPDNPPPPVVFFGPSPCRARFLPVRVYPYWGMSGWEWTLYRRTDHE